MTMQPLQCWPREERARIRGVLTDIDDTLTTEGAITPDALRALTALRARGVPVIAVTGRPVGWSEPFALQWPIDAIVAENGAVALTRNAGSLRKLYAQDTAVREANFKRMQAVAQRILREVPGATLARDSAGRETDIAIDHSEFTQLPDESIDAVARVMREAGMKATISSIHINGWFGEHDKLSGARWVTGELLGRNIDAELDCWAYMGDSTNDVLMFEHFPNSVGVANIRRFAHQLSHPPRYVTQAERGAGFAELARAILEARG